MLIYTPLSAQVSAKLVTLRRSLMGWTDARVGLMNEIINGMQVGGFGGLGSRGRGLEEWGWGLRRRGGWGHGKGRAGRGGLRPGRKEFVWLVGTWEVGARVRSIARSCASADGSNHQPKNKAGSQHAAISTPLGKTATPPVAHPPPHHPAAR